jgi:DHA2 family multidrug resistance protein
MVPQATGLYNFLRITAGSFAASVVTTGWDRLEDVHQTRLTETMGAQTPSFVQSLSKLQGAGLSPLQSVGAVANQVVNQAYMLATVDIFRICTWLVVIVIPMVWLTRKAVGSGGAAHAAD